MNKLITLSEVLICKTNDSKKGIYIIDGRDKEEFLSYMELYKRSLILLKNLQNNGIQKREELIFQLKDYKSFIITFWACILGGIIPVPLTVGSNNEHRLKVFNIWKVLNSPYLVCDWDFINDSKKYAQENNLVQELKDIENKTLHITNLDTDNGEGLIAESSEEDIAFIQFSSGSTGIPKGVVLTHKNLVTNIEDIIHSVALCEDDSTLSWMPLTHDMGIIGFHMTPLVKDINQYIIPTNTFIRNPLLWLEKASEHRATILSSPNFGYKYYLQHLKDKSLEVDLSCVRKIFNGAEPISVDVIEEFMNRLKPYGLRESTMYPVYGMAEASLAIAFTPVDENYSFVRIDRNYLGIGQQVVFISDSTSKDTIVFVDEGYPVKNCFVRVVDNEDVVLPENTIGNIQIKGKNVTKQYYNNEDATNTLITKDGWLRTGDLGFFRNKRLIVTGRAKDIIFINGANFYPHDLERIAIEATGIELGKIVVCGSYNEKLQKEEVLFFVVHKKDLTNFLPIVKDIKTQLYLNIGVVVDHVLPVRNIPKTTSGKVQRYKLAEEYRSGDFSEIVDEIDRLNKEIERNRNIQPAGNEVEENLVSICKEVFNAEIGVNDNFYDLGGNSLILTTIHQKIDILYPGKITTSDLFAYPTISELANYILSAGFIELNTIRLQDSYFDDKNISQDNSLKITLKGKVFNGIIDIAERENMDAFQVVASMFMFSLSRISKDDVIYLQCAQNKKEYIIEINADFSIIKNFEELFVNVKKSFSSEYNGLKYLVKDISRIKLRKGEQSVLPFVYETNSLAIAQEINKVYDILLQIQQSDSELGILCSYNSKKLSKSGMVKFISYYASSLEKLAVNY